MSAPCNGELRAQADEDTQTVAEVLDILQRSKDRRMSDEMLQQLIRSSSRTVIALKETPDEPGRWLPKILLVGVAKEDIAEPITAKCGAAGESLLKVKTATGEKGETKTTYHISVSYRPPDITIDKDNSLHYGLSPHCSTITDISDVRVEESLPALIALNPYSSGIIRGVTHYRTGGATYVFFTPEFKNAAGAGNLQDILCVSTVIPQEDFTPRPGAPTQGTIFLGAQAQPA